MGDRDRWLSIAEISKHIGATRETIYKWINEKGMPASRVGRFWKFKKDAVDAWIEQGGSSFANNEKKGN